MVTQKRWRKSTLLFSTGPPWNCSGASKPGEMGRRDVPRVWKSTPFLSHCPCSLSFNWILFGWKLWCPTVCLNSSNTLSNSWKRLGQKSPSSATKLAKYCHNDTCLCITKLILKPVVGLSPPPIVTMSSSETSFFWSWIRFVTSPLDSRHAGFFPSAKACLNSATVLYCSTIDSIRVDPWHSRLNNDWTTDRSSIPLFWNVVSLDN